MSGILGYIGNSSAASTLLSGLKCLQHQGYDSAGIATLNGRGLEFRKAAGRIEALQRAVDQNPPGGTIGIAHMRWATHGRPTVSNAHPHSDCGRRIALVHSGIIENHREIRRRLAAEGHRFRSETDSEVIAHLIEHYRTNGLPGALSRAARDLKGAYTLACIAAEDRDTIVALRSGGTPLIIGRGTDEVLLASDIAALLGRGLVAHSLEDGQMAIMNQRGSTFHDFVGAGASSRMIAIPDSIEAARKGGFAHFMLKEIHEQPAAVRDTLRERLPISSPDVSLPELRLTEEDLKGLTRVCFVACGTSLHAAMFGKYIVEACARLPVDVDIASEFRYRYPVLDSRVLTVSISQSGETPDTLAAQREAGSRGSRTAAITNVVGSTLARQSDGAIYTRAGAQTSIASTKTFTVQMAAVALLALRLGQARGFLDERTGELLASALRSVPSQMEALLSTADAIAEVARSFQEARHFICLGGGVHFPLALEGALKLRDVSRVSAEGHAVGEMKGRSLALVDSEPPVVAIAPRGPAFERMKAIITGAGERGDKVIAVVNEDDQPSFAGTCVTIGVPDAPVWTQPFLVAIPLQLLAYHLGVIRGLDVDQPRHHARSVERE